MGYYTHYTLETDHEHDMEKFEAAIREVSGYGCNMFEESIKWYDHEKDMLAVSKQFPDVTFFLTGTGEESTDLWAQWFKNGEVKTWALEVNMPGIDDLPSPWGSEKPGESSAG